MSYNSNSKNSTLTNDNRAFTVISNVCDIIKNFIETQIYNEILIHPIDEIRYKLFIRNFNRLEIKYIKTPNSIRIKKQ